MKVALAMAFVPGLALAETPLSGAEFDARTIGRTLTYAGDGLVWGREEYLKDRRVIWAFEGEPCKYGRWQEPQPGLICFSYDDAPQEQECWRFYDRAGGLVARSELSPEEASLAVVEDSETGMICGGLGV